MIRIAASVLALGLALSGANALAEDAMGMKKDDKMGTEKKDTMKKDSMAKKKPMKKDTMGKKDKMGMKKDGM